MREWIEKLLNEYDKATTEPFPKHPLGSYVRRDIPEQIYQTGIVDKETYYVKGSVGQGQWAGVPWVAIMNRNITTSPTHDVYIVYLLSTDRKTLYLTLNQGCTEIQKRLTSPKKVVEELRETANGIINQLDGRGFLSDDNINLGESLRNTELFYQKGTIYYKDYHKGAIPLEEELRDDLKKMVAIYDDYYRKIYSSGTAKPPTPSHTTGKDEMSTKETIESIKAYIASKGFSYENSLIENFYLCLKSKPFVILAGISGTGKTRLVKLFAEAVGANGRYLMVPVRPDWSDSSDLFGHVDLNGHFIPGPVIGFLRDASRDPQHPYFLCLDEMNLARVEYYLSDILSVIETREFSGGFIETALLVTMDYYGGDAQAEEYFGGLCFPDNLYLIGTVNMDETTFPFSKKVLDRANTIEFNHVDLRPHFDDITEDVKPLRLDNPFFRSEHLLLQDCKDEEVPVWCQTLQEINEILQRANAHVGYRVRDEIVFYLLANKETGLLTENEAMDLEIMQKILPRIQGSSSSVKEMLCDLFKYCAGDFEGYHTQNPDLAKEMQKTLDKGTAKYPRSAAKIVFMVRRFEEDGFTSYWL